MVGYLPNTLPVSRNDGTCYQVPLQNALRNPSIFFSLYLEAQIQSKNLCFPEGFLKGLGEKPHGFSVLAFGDISAWYLANRWSAKFDSATKVESMKD